MKKASAVVAVSVVFGSLAATLIALKVRPVLGFLGAWFFLILAPHGLHCPTGDRTSDDRHYLLK